MAYGENVPHRRIRIPTKQSEEKDEYEVFNERQAMIDLYCSLCYVKVESECNMLQHLRGRRHRQKLEFTKKSIQAKRSFRSRSIGKSQRWRKISSSLSRSRSPRRSRKRLSGSDSSSSHRPFSWSRKMERRSRSSSESRTCRSGFIREENTLPKNEITRTPMEPKYDFQQYKQDLIRSRAVSTLSNKEVGLKQTYNMELFDSHVKQIQGQLVVDMENNNYEELHTLLAKVTEAYARVTEENVKVTEENARVTEENGKVTEENAKVTEENAKVTEEKARVTEENAKVTEENARVTEENVQLKATVSRLRDQLDFLLKTCHNIDDM